MPMTRGNQLPERDKQIVLAAYVYRNTHENRKAHPEAVRQAGGKLPPISDEQWLRITSFNTRKDGHLDERAHHCFTHDHEVPEWAEIIRQWSSNQ